MYLVCLYHQDEGSHSFDCSKDIGSLLDTYQETID